MSILVFGGGGFIGLNIAEAALHAGVDVVLFDRNVPARAMESLSAIGPRCSVIEGDVRDPAAVADAFCAQPDAVVYGAAITADAARDAADPETIIEVNLTSLVSVLRAARDARVRRVINLSSVGALGAAAFSQGGELLSETTPPDPQSFYGLTKFAGERAAERLAALWQLDVRSVRLSAVFGPWERVTHARSTPSPQFQIARCALAGRAATLERPGLRDWLYAPDVAQAVLRLIDAGSPAHALYNISTGRAYSALDWGKTLAAAMHAGNSGFECRLVAPGETATISLHSGMDRASLDVARARSDLGFEAAWDMQGSAAHYAAWIGGHRWSVETQS